MTRYQRLGMETQKHGKGEYTITYMGIEFSISKQWTSGKWRYNQLTTIKSDPDFHLNGDADSMKQAKDTIIVMIGDFFEVKY
jgi:hypothetical protein